MILTGNKLKKVKETIDDDDDDDMLNYLKYAHINHNKNLDRNDLQFYMTKRYNKSTQTDNKKMQDKQIGVGEDELTDEFVKSYVLDMKSSNFSSKEPSRLEKETQANAISIGKNNSKSPPTSDDNDDGEGFIGRNARRGFRLAEFAIAASMTGMNIADAVIDIMKTSAPHHSSDEEAVQQPNTQQEEVTYKRTFITCKFNQMFHQYQLIRLQYQVFQYQLLHNHQERVVRKQHQEKHPNKINERSDITKINQSKKEI